MNEANPTDISLAQAQRAVDSWIKATDAGYFSRLTNLAVLAEEVGEVARIIARTDGDQRPKPSDRVGNDALADELADVLWVTLALANQSGIDISSAFVNNLTKKNIRDKERFSNTNP